MLHSPAPSSALTQGDTPACPPRAQSGRGVAYGAGSDGLAVGSPLSSPETDRCALCDLWLGEWADPPPPPTTFRLDESPDRELLCGPECAQRFFAGRLTTRELVEYARCLSPLFRSPDYPDQAAHQLEELRDVLLERALVQMAAVSV